MVYCGDVEHKVGCVVSDTLAIPVYGSWYTEYHEKWWSERTDWIQPPPLCTTQGHLAARLFAVPRIRKSVVAICHSYSQQEEETTHHLLFLKCFRFFSGRPRTALTSFEVYARRRGKRHAISQGRPSMHRPRRVVPYPSHRKIVTTIVETDFFGALPVCVFKKNGDIQ